VPFQHKYGYIRDENVQSKYLLRVLMKWKGIWGYHSPDIEKYCSKCVAAANSANKILGMINWTILNKDSKIILKLHQSLVRLKLE